MEATNYLPELVGGVVLVLRLTIESITCSWPVYSCPACYWSAGAWGPCNGTCSGAQMTRAVQCISSQGQPAQAGSAPCAQACPASDMPAAAQPCSLAQCPAHLWQPGAWGPCRGNSQNRTVACVDTDGNPASSEVHAPAVLLLTLLLPFLPGPHRHRARLLTVVQLPMRPAVQVCGAETGTQPPSSQLCGVGGCASDAGCSGAGACNATTGACICKPGFAGSSCGVSLGPCDEGDAPAGGDLLCCPQGVVDQQGTCCTSGRRWGH